MATIAGAASPLKTRKDRNAANVPAPTKNVITSTDDDTETGAIAQRLMAAFPILAAHWIRADVIGGAA